MSTKRYNRREFTKGTLGGLGALLGGGMFTAEQAFAKEAEDRFRENRKKYVSTVDNPHIIDSNVYKRFSQANTAFNAVSREMGEYMFNKLGQNAFRNMMQGKTSTEFSTEGSVAEARATISARMGALTMNVATNNTGDEGLENSGLLSWNRLYVPKELAQMPPHEKDATKLTKKAKVMARFLGADLVGVAPLDERWLYSHSLQEPEHLHKAWEKPFEFHDIDRPGESDSAFLIPKRMRHVIVMAFEMNRVAVQTSPMQLVAAGAQMGYARMGCTSASLAEFIRAMGYNAIPCKNDVGLSIPMAVDAGLGEIGRHGLLITPEYGSNIRLAKVITDMPLINDKPINFGLAEFCENCKKCARECPSKSITEGERTWEPLNECNNGGTYKWYNDYKKCARFWLDNGGGCGNCIRSCPFTKGEMWAHKFTEWTIKNVPAANPIWLNLDDAFGYGEQRNVDEFWDLDMTTYGLDPSKI